ncbi:GFA family protein [Niveispirillum sp.]|uniref:GFA family protein n=1 Tax=Niveispirillum sp. TaxID=1917217 RepID=UPI001B50E563|nr:GFA family protein [Niveispirillum sp.]MBP7339188.1 GFA family protein [Niveispirillum sp.]
MEKVNSGSCLCGGVRFQISGDFQSFFLCHCSRCRKDTGSAHAANLFSTTAKITWLSGLDQVRGYRLPDTRHERCFCGICGSALPAQQMNGALLVVPAGSLDGPIDIKPTAHICYGSRAAWDDVLGAVTVLDGLPG